LHKLQTEFVILQIDEELSMNQSEFETALRAEAFDVAVLIEKPVGYSMDLHQHPFDAFALVTEGSISISANGVETTYQAGDVFRLAANTPHLESAVPLGVRYLVGRKPQRFNCASQP
jgi:quercetin dioxygenase-like cupin family protein